MLSSAAESMSMTERKFAHIEVVKTSYRTERKSLDAILVSALCISSWCIGSESNVHTHDVRQDADRDKGGDKKAMSKMALCH